MAEPTLDDFMDSVLKDPMCRLTGCANPATRLVTWHSGCRTDDDEVYLCEDCDRKIERAVKAGRECSICHRRFTALAPNGYYEKVIYF